ncbi:MAG: hypothetical protein ACK4K7_08285 [Allosphingosinicella sp.]|uniref:hypothetical protein n=1 Tax=Allosphingosinicella sp. TaxID=2823234 RepID=UPI00392B3F99
MQLLCRLGLHAADERQVWNDGFYFSRCGRCGVDLLKPGGGSWSRVPKGQRVVWRPREPDEIDWSEWERSRELSS